jgi:hypothetical protein
VGKTLPCVASGPHVFQASLLGEHFRPAAVDQVEGLIQPHAGAFEENRERQQAEGTLVRLQEARDLVIVRYFFSEEVLWSLCGMTLRPLHEEGDVRAFNAVGCGVVVQPVVPELWSIEDAGENILEVLHTASASKGAHKKRTTRATS